MERASRRGVRARLIGCGLSFETNCSFRSVLRGSNGRSYCGVKSLAKAGVVLQYDRTESVTATGRKHVNALIDARCIERL